MTKHTEELIAVYDHKLSLMQAFVACLNSERDYLIHCDTEKLWTLMEEKNRILKEMMDTRDQINRMKGEMTSGHDMTAKDAHCLNELIKKIVHTEQEIKMRVEENTTFIKDTLGFFDELMDTLTSGLRSEPAYHPARRKGCDRSNLIYHKEV